MVRASSYFRTVKRKSCSNRKTILPLYHRSGGITSQNQRALSGTSCIHIFPLLLLLCFFALFWLSYPVNLEVKDGRISKISYSDIEPSKFINETQVDFAILEAIPTPSYASNLQVHPADDQNTTE